MDYLLHIDTSTDLCSVAISGNGTLLYYTEGIETRNHASAINAMIAESLRMTNISFGVISAVVVCEGPGSYTGLRIAMATAKGMCYALEVPLILNDRLVLLSYNALKGQPVSDQNVATILTAREKEYFFGIYNGNECILMPTHITEENLFELLHEKENLHIVTDVSSENLYKLKVNFLSSAANIKIDYHFWADYAYRQFKRECFANLSSSVPLYLKQVYTHK